MKIVSLSVLLLVAMPGGALPGQKPNDPCVNGETTYEMKQCAAKQYRQADDELNRVYRQLMSKLDDEGHKTALKTAQQAWLKYRDTNCDFESYLNRGGSIYSVVVTSCMTSMTTTRTKEMTEEIKRLESE